MNKSSDERNALILTGILTLLAWLCFSVFNTDAHAFFKRASTFDNIGGSLLCLGSWGWVYYVARNGVDGKHFLYWLVGLGFGLSWSCGFNFDYFGI